MPAGTELHTTYTYMYAYLTISFLLGNKLVGGSRTTNSAQPV